MNPDHIVASSLAESFGLNLHTLFQVATSSALVEGLYQGAVCVNQLIEHGAFGLGTFVNLDGEMVIVDGICYQAETSGRVTQVAGEQLVPYAVVTRFVADFSKRLQQLEGIESLVAVCDSLRATANLFYAFRIEGTFASVQTRVMRPVGNGTKLKDAAEAQAEFSFLSQEGTLVGVWAPPYAGAFIVPGYHFHF